MASRHLKRVKTLHSSTIQKLETANFVTIYDMLNTSDLEIAYRADMSLQEARTAIEQVAFELARFPTPAYDLLRVSRDDQLHSSAGLIILDDLPTSLDDVLKGGLSAGALTEICGSGGLGKTQLCLSFIASFFLRQTLPTNLPNVLYLDTEGKFSPQRLAQITSFRWSVLPNAFTSASEAVERVLDHTQVIDIRSFDDMVSMIQSEDLELQLVTERVQVLILDSIAFHARRELDSMSLATRQRKLIQLSATLKKLSHKLNIIVLLTNQATPVYEEEQQLQADQDRTYNSSSSSSSSSSLQMNRKVQPTLGISWSHCVTTRLFLTEEGEEGRREEHDEEENDEGKGKGSKETRTLSIAKSPLAPPLSFRYIIREGGVIQTS